VTKKSRSPRGISRLELSIVYNGVCAKRGNQFFHSETFTTLLRELGRDFEPIRYFGFFLGEGDPGLDHTGESPLALENLEMDVVRGNTAQTSAWSFLWHYIVALWRLKTFVSKSSRIVVFVPSFLSVVAALVAVTLRKELGLYIGGNFSEETRHRNLTLMQRVFYPINRFAVDPLARWVARRATFVITPGYDSYHRLHKTGSRVILPAPLLGVTRRDVDSRTDTCSGDEIVILYVGALRVQKGVLDLVDAFARLQNRVPGERLLLRLIGSGEAETQIRERIASLRLGARVELLGHVKNGRELFDLYRKSDVFALPTYSEGFARALYEAMTFAVPIVTTPVGGIPYLLRHGQHAILVPPGNTKALEAGLFSVIHDRELRRRLIGEARRLMLENVYPRIERDVNLAQQIRREFDSSYASRESIQ